MNDFSRSSMRRGVEPLVCVILQLAACAHFALFYTIQRAHFFPLDIYANGQMKLPYQARMLVGWVLRYGVRLRPVQTLANYMPGPASLKNPYEFLFLTISFFAMLGAVLATQASLRLLTKDVRFSRWASFLLLYMATFNLSLSYGLGYTLPYDVTSLFLFCLCFYLALQRKFIPYYIVFIAAIFNRETACFITLFFLICEWFALEEASSTQRWRRLAAHGLAQAVLWIGIKSYLTLLYKANPVELRSHGLMIFRFGENARYIFNPGEWPQLLSIFGFTLPLLLLGFRWIRDPRIRTACLVMLPLWLLIMMNVSVIIEVRVFNEMSALLALAVGLIIYNWAKDRGLEWQKQSEPEAIVTAESLDSVRDTYLSTV